MDNISGINMKEFFYDLPQDRIAQYPLARRDQSRLLIYRNGEIRVDRFIHLPGHLPDKALLIYNKTRVIQARLQFYKETGALIEIFCLEPVNPTREIEQAFHQGSGVVWKCLVGNSKKWKSGTLKHRLHTANGDLLLKALRVHQSNDHSLIEFRWEPAEISFSEVLRSAGIMPLPPYMKRDSEASDTIRYQTIYARSEGSVAAPTAGLHFTPEVFEKLRRKHIVNAEVTLHVGAGTFKPISAPDITGHEMHTEQIVVPRETVETLLTHSDQPVIAVGTTTLRTLESLYWHGVKAIVDNTKPVRIDVRQWDPYHPEYNTGISLEKALSKVRSVMDEFGQEEIAGETRLIIVPGYPVKIPTILVTNFHMPQSTLLLLVSAFIGDGWREAYRFALENDFRFLSYGDSCLFFRKGQ